jgi:hypothetical protein
MTRCVSKTKAKRKKETKLAKEVTKGPELELDDREREREIQPGNSQSIKQEQRPIIREYTRVCIGLQE